MKRKSKSQRKGKEENHRSAEEGKFMSTPVAAFEF